MMEARSHADFKLVSAGRCSANNDQLHASACSLKIVKNKASKEYAVSKEYAAVVLHASITQRYTYIYTMYRCQIDLYEKL